MFCWLSNTEILSGPFRSFNKRNSVLLPSSYYGIAWEYPWINLVIHYDVADKVLVSSTDRLLQMCRREHKESLFCSIETFVPDHAAPQYHAMIIENITNCADDLIPLLLPFGKLICTFRMPCTEKGLSVLDALTHHSDLMPWKHLECDVLPNDPKYNATQSGRNNATSIGLVFFRKATVVEAEGMTFRVNPLWMDPENRIVEYINGGPTVDTIGLRKDVAGFRVISFPALLQKKEAFSLNDICKVYSADKQTACSLLNEMVAEELVVPSYSLENEAKH